MDGRGAIVGACIQPLFRELTLNAAKKKAMKSDNNKVLEDKKKAELAAEEAKRKQSRDSLRERAALWK